MSSRVTVVLDLPLEFVELCLRDRVDPAAVLKTFIADLCAIQPRTHEEFEANGGYATHGSDERLYARQYYDRDELADKAHWRDRCVINARLLRREAEEHERLGLHGRADMERRRVRFWVREARAWNRCLVRWRQRIRRQVRGI